MFFEMNIYFFCVDGVNSFTEPLPWAVRARPAVKHKANEPRTATEMCVPGTAVVVSGELEWGRRRVTQKDSRKICPIGVVCVHEFFLLSTHGLTRQDIIMVFSKFTS